MLAPRANAVERLFREALPLATDARELLLRDELDAGVRSEVASLLGWAARDDSLEGRVEKGFATPETTLPAGTRLGAHEIRHRLGKGGMGTVYAAVDTRSGRWGALKTVSRPEATTIEAIEREIRTLARLRHPGVVAIHDHGVLDDLPWYVMELVEGAPLARAAGASISGILEVVSRLCETLAYVHAAGVTHGDLKPSNVLVRPDGAPVILDFGLVNVFRGEGGRDSVEGAGIPAGTVAYMPPEQLRGVPIDPRADVYALGCVIHELFTGAPPFGVAPREAVVEGHLRGDVLPASWGNRDVPREIDELLRTMLVKDRTNRLGHMQVAAKVLARVAGRPPLADLATPHLYRASFRGRETTMARVGERIDRLRRNEGGIVLLRGAPGSGKSRVLVEVVGLCRARAIPARSGQSAGATGTGIAALLRGMRGGATRDATIPPRAALAPGGGAGMTEVLAGLRTAVSSGPVVLVADDLDAATEDDVTMLTCLAQGGVLDEMPLLVLAAAREGEPRADLDALAAIPGVETLSLPPLSDDDVAAIASDMLSAPLPRAFTAQLVDLAAGNPWIAAEHARMAVEERGLFLDELGSWEVTSRLPPPRADLRQPASMEAWVARRLSGTTPLARRVLDALAVAGQEAPVGEVALLADLPERDTLDVLVELLHAEFVAPGRCGTWRFLHPELGRAVHVRIEQTARRSMHLAMARRDGGAPSPRLARHWEEGGDAVVAATCYRDAARSALQAGERREAERLFHACLRQGSLDPAEEGSLLEEMAQSLFNPAGRHADAVAAIRRAVDLARRQDDHTSIARRRIMEAASLATTLDQPGAEEACAEGEALLARHPDPALTIRANWVRARLLESRGDIAGADAMLCRNLESQRALGESVASTLYQRFHLLMSHVRLEEASPVCAEIVEAVRSSTDPHVIVQAQTATAWLHTGKGRLDDASAAYGKAIETAERAGMESSAAISRLNLGAVHLMQDDPAAAVVVLERGIAALRELGSPSFEAWGRTQLGWACAGRGEHAAGLAHLERARDIARRCGIARTEGLALVGIVGVSRLSNAAPAAYEPSLDAAEAIFRRLSDPNGLCSVFCERAHLAFTRKEPAWRSHVGAAREQARKADEREQGPAWLELRKLEADLGAGAGEGGPGVR